MCNLNILIKKKGVEQTQVLGFMSCITLESYNDNNNDADGIYFSSSNSLFKSEEKLNICDYPTECDKSKFIVSHQRFTTSGKGLDYAQPFECKKEEFVIAHNGVINSFKGSIGSDTFGYFYDYFLEEFKNGKGSREKRLINSIKTTLKEVSGSYSITLYDTKRKVLYYFKNTSKSINFYKSDDDDILYISTRKKNSNYLYFFNREFSEMSVKSFAIYRISVGKKIEVKKIARIPKSPHKRSKKIGVIKPKIYSGYVSYNNNRYAHNNCGLNHKKEIEDIFDTTEILSYKNDRELGRMLDTHFGYGGIKSKKEDTLEEIILDEMLDGGYSLKEMGFEICKTNSICYHCSKRATFTDSYGCPICLDCIKTEQNTINREFCEAEDYMSWGDF